MTALRVGVVGVGHLGRHHARILASLPGVTLVGVADTRLEQAQAVACPLGSAAYDDPFALIDKVDAVSIAVPTKFHRNVAAPYLERGIATLIEKPLATSLREAEELVLLAKRNNAVLQVGHIERFNPTLGFLKQSGLRPRYLDAERLSTYTFRSTDIGVVLDLMIHDIDLVLSTVGCEVVAVSAVGMSVFGGFEDVASARLWFEDGTVADLSASRASLHAVRNLRVWSEQGYVALDLKTRQAMTVRPSDGLLTGNLSLENVNMSNADEVKSHLFGKVLDVQRHDATADTREPLALELTDFVESTRERRKPQVSGDDALDAMRVADLVLQGIATHPWGGVGTPSGQSQPHGIPAPHVLQAERLRSGVRSSGAP
jgi:predicted dehydrogenase